MRVRGERFGLGLLSSAGFLSLTALLSAANAETAHYRIAPQPLGQALQAFGAQSGHPMIVDLELVRSKQSRGLVVSADPETALRKLLDGTGLAYKRNGEIFAIVAAQAPAPEAPIATVEAAEAVSGSAVEGLVVTAQKRREAIQDVPIAISAFSADALQAQKIEGGFDLLKAIPNVTFSKNNFSGYNFSIRGIGTKAISVTTDPGVAVSFNDTTLIRNRLFEQEYFDVERVEVLRGPQGTLYGRNATSGVINLVSQKPDLSEFEGSLKGEVGNYHTKRLTGMINVPLIEDVLGVRFAGAMTSRDGYDFNLYTQDHTNGRDLWSGRLTIGFAPTERVRADLVWERFHEDDDRARTGKQLCTNDPGPETIDGVSLAELTDTNNFPRRNQLARGKFTQGCLPGSLYDDAAFGTPNALAIPYIQAIGESEWGVCASCDPNDPTRDTAIYILSNLDVYGNQKQSRDLRSLYSQILPHYRAEADVFELNLNVDVTDALTLSSQTAYVQDEVYSTQDFNRFTTLPVFGDSSLAFNISSTVPSRWNTARIAPNGVFCDPQVACSDTIVGQDLSRANSEQFSQAFRLQSAFDGPLNFSVGVDYTRYQTVEDYYVFFNGITLAGIALINGFSLFPIGGLDPSKLTTNPNCAATTDILGPTLPDGVFCVPIEQNPISNIQNVGHNYFLSRNPYKLNSHAAFGEAYWQVNDTIKITAGLRYTDDEKKFIPIPSQTLLSDPTRIDAFAPIFGGAEQAEYIKGGLLSSFAPGLYPALPEVTLGWQEVTGRLGVDWKPNLSFTDETMIYAFYSRGYKGGGMNPPPIGVDYEAAVATGRHFVPSAPPFFRPEFVNAFEVGTKNTLLGGGLVVNTGVFLYDYKDYQVSKIVDRSAQNENFDARVWGAEFESVFAPNKNLRINASIGYLDTELADGSKSIDILNRTAGHDDWVVIKPFYTLFSNCIAPASVARKTLVEYEGGQGGAVSGLCPGLNDGTTVFPDGTSFNLLDYPEANFGAGFDTDLSGHELPNSPHWTVMLGAQYSWDLLDGNWSATVRGDAYWQSQSWARPYQLPIDKLHGWYNSNLSFWIEKPADDLRIEFYIKNLLDDTPITDTFTNSDDTALTTNIFVLDPRLIGLSVTKGF